MRGLALLVSLALLASGCAGAERSDSTSAPTTTASATQKAPATPTGASPAKDQFRLTEIAKGLTSPVYVTHAGDGSGRLFVVEQPGRILILRDGVLSPVPFLDIRDLVQSGGERGLLSVAFYPDYETSGRFIVDYTRKPVNPQETGNTIIARYKVSANPDLADPASAEILMMIDDLQSNHNGGLVKFGPDGMLYIGMGDGGGAGDLGQGHAPEGNGQNLQTWLGKMLRIDVSGPGAYKVPDDNPDLGAGSKPEIWAYGLRNPWRFSFDRATGDLYIGDVGQNAWEEVNHQPRSSKGGENYGWPVWEGTHLYRPGTAVVGDTKPVGEYQNPTQGCSVTGGYVYRGARITALEGYYILGDYCQGTLWTLAKAGSTWTLALLLDTDHSISSFGEDEAGELYLVEHTGFVYRFDPV